MGKGGKKIKATNISVTFVIFGIAGVNHDILNTSDCTPSTFRIVSGKRRRVNIIETTNISVHFVSLGFIGIDRDIYETIWLHN